LFVLSSYGRSQRRDHDQYDRVYDPTQPLTTENIPLHNQNDPWDSRPSGDDSDLRRQGSKYTHVRQQSSTSASEVFGQAYQEPKDAFSTSTYEYSADPSNPPNPVYPTYAYTENTLPTPTNNYYNSADSQIERPAQVQSHPGMSTHRKF